MGKGRKPGFVGPLKGRKGAKHPKSILWDLYHHGKLVGTYKGLHEASIVSGESKMRLWQLANGYHGGTKICNHPIVSQTGFTALKHGEEYGWWEEE